MNHFNELTPKELERLVILSEECSEVIQIISKILRHGYASYHPDDPDARSNRVLLEKELGDVMFAIDLLIKHDDVSPSSINRFSDLKLESIKKYLHHNEV